MLRALDAMIGSGDLVQAAVNSALRAAQQLAQAQGGPLANLKDMFPGMVP